jgi:beta-galactosidase
VLPHWNWAGYEGKLIPVFAYSNGDEAELFLNGKSLGKKKRFGEPVTIPAGPNVSQDRKYVTKHRLMWEVQYAPGTLKAVAYRNGKPVATDEVKTAGAAARVRLIPDRATIKADGEDLAFVTARIEDEDGNLVPGADNLIVFDVSGTGRREAVDNGNAASEESFQADQRKAFSGMALLIVRSEKGKAGLIRINALAGNLKAARAEIRTQR